MSSRRPSSTTWLVTYVFFPLVPFLLEGGIRCVVYGLEINWSTFSSSTLAMSMALQCLFVLNCLSSHEFTIPSEEENERKKTTELVFSILAIIGFVVFGIIVALNAFYEVTNVEHAKLVRAIFDKFVFVGTVLPMIYTVWAQRSFKLRTVL
ncbi:hypothetical protein [Vibrio parahaemolyticus]|uniref:hypothetical protein n=1 Tax=Vibrio parahaemolyticus TaxID=670 RepID=UPI001123EA6A|nr:hypothetical protein [Vibrio parahaemolyticus]HDM8062606.1 hypothetical protein [Vibrio harveyi]